MLIPYQQHQKCLITNTCCMTSILTITNLSFLIEGADPGGDTRRPPPLKLEKIWFVCVKSWFFTRNTPTMFALPSARRNYCKCALPLTWNPGSAPVIAPVQVPHSYIPTGQVITGDLSWFWLSYLGPLVLLLSELYITCIWISNLSIFESNRWKLFQKRRVH